MLTVRSIPNLVLALSSLMLIGCDTGGMGGPGLGALGSSQVSQNGSGGGSAPSGSNPQSSAGDPGAALVGTWTAAGKDGSGTALLFKPDGVLSTLDWVRTGGQWGFEMNVGTYSVSGNFLELRGDRSTCRDRKPFKAITNFEVHGSQLTLTFRDSGNKYVLQRGTPPSTQNPNLGCIDEQGNFFQ